MTAHPVVIFAGAWIGLAIAGLVRWPWRPPVRAVRSMIVAASVTATGTFCAIAVWYAAQLSYFDVAEPTITAVASVFGAGGALYPSLEAPERYAHIYGPALFMAHAWTMNLLGQSIVVSKFVGAAAILASLGAGFWAFAARAGRVAASIAVGASVLVYMDFGNVAFWTRAEPLLMLCVTLGLISTRLSGRLSALLLLGVATGVACDLKISGPVYLGPLFLLAARKHGSAAAIGAAGVAVLVAAAPFVLPTVSLAHYLEYIKLSARNGLVAGKIRQNLEWAVFLALPVGGAVYAAIASESRPRDRAGFALAAGLSLAIIGIIAAKPGGGPYHLLPCVPVCAFAVLGAPSTAWNRPWLRRLALAFGLTAAIVAVPKQLTFVATVSQRQVESAADDLRRFADAHPSRAIEVGYSDTWHDSDVRPVLVFRTRRYLIDAPAVQEYRLSGLDVPAATLRAIADCRVQYWLIPKGGDVFALPSAYWPSGPSSVFSDAFRRAFLDAYGRSGATTSFNVWECKKRS